MHKVLSEKHHARHHLSMRLFIIKFRILKALSKWKITSSFLSVCCLVFGTSQLRPNKCLDVFSYSTVSPQLVLPVLCKHECPTRHKLMVRVKILVDRVPPKCTHLNKLDKCNTATSVVQRPLFLFNLGRVNAVSYVQFLLINVAFSLEKPEAMNEWQISTKTW